MGKRKQVKSTRQRSPQAPPRAISGRQRQRLIEACISALHVHGPSQTTVEKVVAIARMSPGIVRFYFDSKAAMLVASLQFLADEFEEQVLLPVSRLKHDPVAALKRLVDLYLDAQIASPRKVSVWYSFWGEASSRKEYYDLCGKKDENFALLVRELIGSLIDSTGQRSLDTDAVALGLIGVLEVLWQDFAFQDESAIDRRAAHARAMAYLASIFPSKFIASGSAKQALPPSPARDVDAGLARALQSSTQLVGHSRLLPMAGSYLALDSVSERALVVRDTHGTVRAFRNCCMRGTHALVDSGLGSFNGQIECSLHSLQFGLDGSALNGAASLRELPLEDSRGFLSLAGRGAPTDGVARAWLAFMETLEYLAPLPWMQRVLEADWTILVQQWLDAPAADGERRAYIYPNQLIELRDDGAAISQVIPRRRGQSLLREFPFAQSNETRRLRVMRYLAERARRDRRRRTRALAESAQSGIDRFGYSVDGDESLGARLEQWLQMSRAQLIALESD